jgi:hypothetical protein
MPLLSLLQQMCRRRRNGTLNKWAKAFFQRGGLSRRKITGEDKAISDDDVVANTLRIGQDLYVAHFHNPRTCWNYDETAFTWAIGPSYMYCPGNQLPR